jgi:hypothetical protein
VREIAGRQVFRTQARTRLAHGLSGVSKEAVKSFGRATPVVAPYPAAPCLGDSAWASRLAATSNGPNVRAMWWNIWAVAETIGCEPLTLLAGAL